MVTLPTRCETTFVFRAWILIQVDSGLTGGCNTVIYGPAGRGEHFSAFQQSFGRNATNIQAYAAKPLLCD